ncbi:MAG: membrane dipeptidase [Planctomycetota bacterium]|nr:membrane dipeptidase [Planctomycetota bacterium]
MFIVDAHLDLADNAMAGRAVEKPAREQTPDDLIPTVGLPDLRAGGVNLIGATIFCMPSIDGRPGYQNAEEAHQQAMDQLQWYQRQEKARTLTFVRNAGQMPGAESPRTTLPLATTHAILLLEGADAIRDDRDVELFFNAGVRMVGLAWKRTRYAGGTGAPGPLTRAGQQLLTTLDRFGVIHDTSHLAEDSFWDLLAMSEGPVMATHANCRAIVPTDRQLSDKMIRALAARQGVIGINFFDKFLVPPEDYGKRRATLADVVAHIKHMCDLLGDATHVGIGTDMDGGLGREQIPVEIETSADFPRIAQALSSAGFGDQDVRDIMGENWRRFFLENLPLAVPLAE